MPSRTQTQQERALAELDARIASEIMDLPGVGWYRPSDKGNHLYELVSGPEDFVVQKGVAYDYSGSDKLPPREIETSSKVYPSMMRLLRKVDGLQIGSQVPPEIIFAIPQYSTNYCDTAELLKKAALMGLRQEAEIRLVQGLWSASPSDVCLAVLEAHEAARDRAAHKVVYEAMKHLLPAIGDISEGRQWQGGKEMMVNASELLHQLDNVKSLIRFPPRPSDYEEMTSYLKWRLKVPTNSYGETTTGAISNAVHALACQDEAYQRRFDDIRRLSHGTVHRNFAQDGSMYLSDLKGHIKSGGLDKAEQLIDSMKAVFDEYAAILNKTLDLNPTPREDG